MKKLCLIVLMSLFVVSCVTMRQPSQQDLNSADYGELPSDYKKQIVAYFDKNLLDPFSAIYVYCEPFKTWMGKAVGPIGKREANFTYGWALCGEVNAKNRFGGYVGGMQFFAFFSDGNLQMVYEKAMASGPCRKHIDYCEAPKKRE